MSSLSLELLGHKARFVLPVETLCLELQTVSDKLSSVGGSVSVYLNSGAFFLRFRFFVHVCKDSDLSIIVHACVQVYAVA